MTNVIEMSKVSKRYQHFNMEQLDLTLEAGQIMGLVGVNGAGKSTTIRMLMGLIAADSGEVQVLGHRLPEEQILAKQRIGYASEDLRLYKARDLAWHMKFVESIYGDWDQAYAQNLVQKFDLKTDQKLKGFSHGQRVKASLLLLLARKPDLLILDEPTTGLDPVARSEVVEELAEILRDENRSVLFSSHNTHDVEQLSDSLTFLHDGRILASQDIESFLNGWRNIRCQGEVDANNLCLPSIANVRQSGSITSIKLDEFNDECLDVLRAQGLEVIDVNRMSLEEIFIASVKRGKRYES
jgi:ABC-2 type transport system ATP-binding protein